MFFSPIKLKGESLFKRFKFNLIEIIKLVTDSLNLLANYIAFTLINYNIEIAWLYLLFKSVNAI